MHSLDEIVGRGLFHSALESIFVARLTGKGRDSHEYKIALAKRTAIQEIIVKLMEDQKLDALAYPTSRRKPARINDPQAGGTCQLSASTGFPAISMPAGFTSDGLPVALELLGRAFDDAKLISYAYSYEQATSHRRAPARTPSLAAIQPINWKSSSKAGTATLTAQFKLDPTTNELSYKLYASGFADADLLAATIHRQGKDGNGPVIAVLAYHPFETIEGATILSDPDREKMMSGGLYLRLATRSKVTNNLRISLKPTAAR